MSGYVVQRLMTEEIRAKLPPLYTSEMSDALVYLKLFHPYGRGTWYVIEWDGTDLLYSFCESMLGADCDEMGYASLAELTGLRARVAGVEMPFQAIERDEHWTPIPLRRVRAYARWAGLPDDPAGMDS